MKYWDVWAAEPQTEYWTEPENFSLLVLNVQFYSSVLVFGFRVTLDVQDNLESPVAKDALDPKVGTNPWPNPPPWLSRFIPHMSIDVWFLKFMFQVIKETLSVVPAHLETRGLPETSGPQVMIWFWFCLWFSKWDRKMISRLQLCHVTWQKVLFEPSGGFQDESAVFLSQDLLDLEGILEDLVSSVVQDRRDAKEIQAIRGSWVNQVPQLTWTSSVFKPPFCNMSWVMWPATIQNQ